MQRRAALASPRRCRGSGSLRRGAGPPGAEAAAVTRQRQRGSAVRRAAAPSSTCGSSWRSAPAPPGPPASRRRGATSAIRSRPSGSPPRERAFEAQTPLGPLKMVNLSVVDSRRQPRTAADRRTLRHQAVPPLPVRRRKRRRIERRHAPGARTGAEGPQEPVHDRAGVLRRRGSRARVDRHRSHVRQPPLRRDRPRVGHADRRSGRCCWSTWSATAA